MKVFFVLAVSFLAGCAHQSNSRIPSSDDQASGEAQFFGNSNLVKDAYGDIEVVNCGAGKWVVFVSPAMCRRAAAQGHACADVAPLQTPPTTPTLHDGTFFMTFNGIPIEIRSTGDGRSALSTPVLRNGPAIIESAANSLSGVKLAQFCKQ